MYGVIICPRCNRARGVDLSVKTSKCPGCGLHSEVDRMHTYFQTDNEQELAEAVRRTSSRMQHSIEDYGDDVVVARQAAEEQRKRSKNQSLDFDGMVLIAHSLASETGFGLNEV
jgi:transcription elongation factor Elf1